MYIKFNNKSTPYFQVLIIFIFAFIFGKNMEVSTPAEKNLQDQNYAQQKLISGNYDVSSSQNELKLDNVLSVSAGQCGKIFFDVKNASIQVEDDVEEEIHKIQASLVDNYNQNLDLGEINLANNSLVTNHEFSFCSSSDYRTLLLKKDQNSSTSAFEISNIQYFPLASTRKDLANLKPTIKGDTDFSQLIYDSKLEFASTGKGNKFTRHNQTIGQTFTADSDYVSGVDMKLDFSGTGGNGNYFLELREASNHGQGTLLGSDRIAYYYFSSDDAEKNLKISDNLYHIPLAAKLEKGKTYFIGISNEAVKFNVLNTLSVSGGGTSSDTEKVINSISGKPKQTKGKLYLKVYGAKYLENSNDKILTNAKIIDRGDGTGVYSYDQKGNFSDYLDLLSSGSQNVFYDNVAQGISAKDFSDNNFTYKINTVYPFTKMNISASQPGGQFTNSLVYYSFDNQNWQPIEATSTDGDATSGENNNQFQKLIQGNGGATTVYLKNTYDEKDAIGKSVHLFGLKNLKVYADLNIR